MCSDQTAGGRNENEDIRVSELECPVSTDPAEIARSLDGDGITRVVFCTYHSLVRVTEAQAGYGAPAFDLAIVDEAHRTTGAIVDGRGICCNGSQSSGLYHVCRCIKNGAETLCYRRLGHF